MEGVGVGAANRVEKGGGGKTEKAELKTMQAGELLTSLILAQLRQLGCS